MSILAGLLIFGLALGLGMILLLIFAPMLMLVVGIIACFTGLPLVGVLMILFSVVRMARS